MKHARTAEVAETENASLRKPWRAPAVEVLMMSQTQSNPGATSDLAGLGHS